MALDYAHEAARLRAAAETLQPRVDDAKAAYTLAERRMVATHAHWCIALDEQRSLARAAEVLQQLADQRARDAAEAAED